ncbi:hypothetical protein [Frankia nepalensis]|uniref:Uncharacterized protein n=1 Tax=Frankia nepalensis TaxID=1836974 RepID=A0A937RM91_9ACTN|nr:hypothetical protein [Frankia nepalensis]MBL7632825.1 hypothetical protein [Frankia nepalensis]
MAAAFFLTIPGLVVLLLALAAADRFGSWLRGRSWLPWHRRTSHRAVSAVAFDELAACLYAGKRHQIEQRALDEALPADDDKSSAPPSPHPAIPPSPEPDGDLGVLSDVSGEIRRSSGP